MNLLLSKPRKSISSWYMETDESCNEGKYLLIKKVFLTGFCTSSKYFSKFDLISNVIEAFILSTLML